MAAVKRRPAARRGPTGGNARRAEAGFSLLEMIVVAFLIAVSLALSVDLLREAQTLSAGATRKLADPLGSLATARLRKDLQGSRRIVGLGLFWSSEPLSVTGYHPNTIITYRREGEVLERLLFDLSTGALVSREEQLRGVVGWRWRQAAPGLVDVELTYRRAPELSAYRLDGAPGRRPADVWETEALRLALRGRARGAGW